MSVEHIKAESLQRLMETSQVMHGKLVASPLWDLLKTDPEIMNWINSLSTVDSEMKSGQVDPKLFGGKE
jgi:hypothetical protein